MLGIGASGAAGPVTAEIVLTALVVVFGAGWAWLGASAVRADRGGIPARPGAALP